LKAITNRNEGNRQLAGMLGAARTQLEQWIAQTAQQAALLQTAERMLATLEVAGDCTGEGHRAAA
jgi:hypothetical protein